MAMQTKGGVAKKGVPSFGGKKVGIPAKGAADKKKAKKRRKD